MRAHSGLLIGVAALITISCRSQHPSSPATTASTEPTAGEHQTSTGVLAELNVMRRDPPSYATRMEARRPYYAGHLLRIPGEVPLQTNEGVAALDEAVAVLRRTPPLPLIAGSEALMKAARDHASDIG